MTISILALIGFGLGCFVFGFCMHRAIAFINKQEEINDFIMHMEQERQEQEPIKVKLEDGWRMWLADEEDLNGPLTEEEELIAKDDFLKRHPKL